MKKWEYKLIEVNIGVLRTDFSKTEEKLSRNIAASFLKTPVPILVMLILLGIIQINSAKNSVYG